MKTPLTYFHGPLFFLGDRVFEYRARFRELGFSLCFLYEDWLQKNCTKEELDYHLKYVIEATKEALSSPHRFEVFFGDSLDIKSDWLRREKALAMALGTAPPTLSPCEKKLLDMLSNRAGEQFHELQLERQSRRAYEISRFSEKIDEIINKNISPHVAAVDTFLESYSLPHDVATRVCDDGLEMLICLKQFNLSCLFWTTSRPEYGTTGGALNCKVRIARDMIEGDWGEQEITPILNMFPNGLADYFGFSDPKHAALNSIALAFALNLILPDFIDALLENALSSKY